MAINLANSKLSRRNKNQLISEINITPFVDVMLVLLVVFMVTAPMMISGINVDLPKDVKKLYESWWIPRIENIDELLKLCSIENETNTQKKQIIKLFENIEELKTSLKDLTDQISSQGELASGANDLAIENQDKIAATESSVGVLDKKVSELGTKIISEINTHAKPLDEKISKLTERLKLLDQQVQQGVTTKDLKADLKKLSDETKTTMSQALQALSGQLTKSIKDDVSSEFKELESKFLSMTKEMIKKSGVSTEALANIPSAGARYRSPLSSKLPGGTVPYRINQELDFINCWLSHLAVTQGIDISFEQAAAYHAAFLANHVIISDLRLIASWVDCLGWRQFAMHMVASPTWASEEDWGVGAEHLFKEESQHQPKLLMIHNYDVGLPDCYLAPSLLLWALHGDSKGLSKIFLIPSQEAPPSSQILEHAVYIGTDDHKSIRSLSLRSGARTPSPIRQKMPTGVDPRTVFQWLQPPGQLDYDFTIIHRSLSLEISQRLIGNFRKTASLAGRYLDEPFALGAGMHHQILPWVRSRYGDSAYGELGAFLKQFPDIKY